MFMGPIGMRPQCRYAVSIYAQGDPENPPKDADVRDPKNPQLILVVFRTLPDDPNVAVEIAVVEAREQLFKESEGWISRYVHVRQVTIQDFDPRATLALAVTAEQEAPAPVQDQDSDKAKDAEALPSDQNGGQIEDKPAPVNVAHVHVEEVVKEWYPKALAEAPRVCIAWPSLAVPDQIDRLYKQFCWDPNAMPKCRETITTDDEIKKLVRPIISRLYKESIGATV